MSDKEPTGGGEESMPVDGRAGANPEAGGGLERLGRREIVARTFRVRKGPGRGQIP